MLHKAWSSIEEVPYCFWRSSIIFQGHSAKKIVDFEPKLGVSRLKNWRFESNLSKITRPVAAIKSLRFALLNISWHGRKVGQRHMNFVWMAQCKTAVPLLPTCNGVTSLSLSHQYHRYFSFALHGSYGLWCLKKAVTLNHSLTPSHFIQGSKNFILYRLTIECTNLFSIFYPYTYTITMTSCGVHMLISIMFLLQCPIEWFHYGCVGLTQAPKGKWYCPQCMVAMKRRGRK